MTDPGKDLERLLRAAAQVPGEEPAAAPFGFDTRIVALWREGKFPRNGLSGLLRRVAMVSAAVLVVSTVAVLRELQHSDEIGDTTTNEYVIADAAIQNEFLK